MGECKLFISLSDADSALGDAVYRLVNVGVGLESWHIFKFDIPASGGKLGDDRVLRIREALNSSQYVLLIVSSSFLESDWCRFEFGAAWALNKQRGGLVVPPCTPESCPEIIGRDDLLVLGPALPRKSLAKLVSSIEKALKVKRSADWDEEAEAFCGALKGLLPPEDTDPPTTGTATRQAELALEDAANNESSHEALPVRSDQTGAEITVAPTETIDLCNGELAAVEDLALEMLGACRHPRSYPETLIQTFLAGAGIALNHIGSLLERNRDAIARMIVWRANRREKGNKQYPFLRGEGVIVLCHVHLFNSRSGTGLAKAMDAIHQPKEYNHTRYACDFEAAWKEYSLSFAL